MWETLFFAFGTLFTIVNPISTTFVFDTFTAGFTEEKRLRAALIATATCIIALMVFLCFGQWMLGFFGVTIYAFRVAGGLYLGKIAFEMLSQEFYKKAEPRENHESQAIMPIGIPLLTGPGAMATVLVLNQEPTFTSFIAIGLAILLVGAISFVLLFYSHQVSARIGKTGAKVVERILGLIVLVIAAQFIFHGVSGYLASIGVGI